MFTFHAITRAVSAFRQRRTLRHTERLIANLPPEVRKDIGWPDTRNRAYQKPRGFVL